MGAGIHRCPGCAGGDDRYLSVSIGRHRHLFGTLSRTVSPGVMVLLSFAIPPSAQQKVFSAMASTPPRAFFCACFEPTGG